MTPLLWTAFGMAIGAAVLHGALGLRRPRDRTYLSFAFMMALVAVFLYYQSNIYRATTAAAAVEATRRQLIVIDGFIACMLVFIPSYTKVRFPRALAAAFWAGLVFVALANLLAPYGLWYSAQPELVQSEFRGEPYNIVIAQPMGPLQYFYTLYFTSLLLVSLGCALKVFYRGERQRGATLAFAVALILVHALVDVVRDNVGGTWPYVAEFGVVTWGLIMSVQLAHDFRAQAEALGDAIVQVETHARRLRSILASMRALEQNMHAPLNTLETGVSELAADTSQEAAQLARLRRAVTRLREFSREMPDIRAHAASSSRPGT